MSSTMNPHRLAADAQQNDAMHSGSECKALLMSMTLTSNYKANLHSTHPTGKAWVGINNVSLANMPESDNRPFARLMSATCSMVKVVSHIAISFFLLKAPPADCKSTKH